jgi:phosphomannomutase
MPPNLSTCDIPERRKIEPLFSMITITPTLTASDPILSSTGEQTNSQLLLANDPDADR